MARVCFIDYVPELVLNSVRAPKVLKESIPLIARHQVFGDARLVFQLIEQLIKHTLRATAGISLRQVQSVWTKLFFKFRKQRTGIREVSPPAGSHEVGYHQPVYLTRRICAREVMNHDALAGIRKQIPDCPALTKRCVDCQLAS